MHCTRLWLAALALALVAIAGCARQPDHDVLRRGNGGDPGTLDPSLAEDVHAFAVLGDLYEGLVAPGPDGTIVPGVAESHSVSRDGLRYDFRLRADARWSDGSPVVAGDFVRRIRDVAAPGSTSAYGFLLAPISNFDAVSAGRLPADSLGVEALDRHTLRLTLDRPAPQLMSVLTMPVAYPMHAAARRDGATPGAAPGNGAYRLVAWQPGDVLRLERNPRYWNADSVAIEQVEYYPIVEPAAELNLYRARELDITHTVPPASLERLREERPGELRIAARLALYYVALDLGEPPLDKQPLREALSMAVDREAIARMLGRGEKPAYGLVPAGVPGYSPVRYDWRSARDEDRKRLARDRLAAAGIEPADLPPLRLVYDDGDVHERVALAVAGMWQDVLGLEVELDKREWKRFLETRARRDEWDAMRFSWFGDYEDPATFTELFRSGSDQNLPGYDSAAYDALLDRATTADGAARASLLASAERRFLDDYPIVPLYFYVSKHLVSPRVRGFEDNALDRHPSRFLSFEEL